MRKISRSAIFFILAVTWFAGSLSTEARAQGVAAGQNVSAAAPGTSIRRAYSLAERLDWSRCTASGYRRAEQAEELLDQLTKMYKQAILAEDFQLASAIDDAGEELDDALEWFYEDCGPPRLRLGDTFFYIPGTETSLRIEGGIRKPTFELSGEFGILKRADFGSALQLESGGSLVSGQFGYVSRKDDYQAFEVKGTIPSLSGSFDSYLYGYRFGTASGQSTASSLTTDGNSLNIYSPAGPSGGLGGGVRIGGGGGFADVTDLRYADSYSEHLGYLGVRFGTWDLKATGASITPYAKLLAGYVRESSNYSGATASGGLMFDYQNGLNTWRGGAELGGRIEQPINDKFGVYGDAAVRFIYNKSSIDSTLNLSGLLTATETASADAHKFDVGFVGGGGIYLQSGNATLSAGVAVETWQVPNLMFSQTAPVSIEYDDRLSVTGRIGLRLTF